MKTDASINDPLHHSPTMPNLLSSQNIAELNSSNKYKRRKRQKTRHNAIESDVDGCGAPEGTLSTENSTPALDMSSEHPIQYVSTDPVTGQSCARRDFCHEENEGKEHDMLRKTAESGNGEHELPEASGIGNKFVANAEGFVEESVLEVVDFNIQQVGLMEKEPKLSSKSEAAAEEMKLMTENVSDPRFVTTSSVVDIPVVQLEETSDRQLDHIEITRNDLYTAGDVADLSVVSIKDDDSKISHFSPDRTIASNSKKKLLVLDVNGLLADFVSHVPRGNKPDLIISGRSVYKRPFCDDFLQFCFDRFHVGVWSSRAKRNVDTVIEFLMGKSASKLLFCWNQSHCTTTKFSTVENTTKPLVLKELRKLWEKLEPGLPWEKGEFNESNTLLLDDSPYKALGNPKYTAIFPYSYQYRDASDTSLGPGGDLRVYLEGLAVAKNVQEYVASNPFGQRAIRESNPSWGYYRKVIDALKRRQNATSSSSGGE